MQWWVSLFWTLNYVLNFSKVNRLFKISRLYHIYQAIPAYHEPSRLGSAIKNMGLFSKIPIDFKIETMDF